MKKLLLLTIGIILLSCTTHDDNLKKIEEQHNRQLSIENKIQYKNVTINKVIKDLKEIQEQHTAYHYKFDVLNGKFRQQPNVYTETQYFLIYVDNTHEEVDRNTWLNYSKGDTIKKVIKVPI